MSFKKYRIKEKTQLVTDQPGRQIFIVGLVMAITLGFILRGLTSSQVIHQKLQEATRSLGKTTTISWSQAQFSFRRGIFIPQLSVQVQNVRLVSSEACWGEPILFTKVVELPLSITGWLSQGQPLQILILKDSFLEMRSAFNCDSSKTTTEETRVVENTNTKSIRIKSRAEGVSRPPVVISDFQFEGIKIRNPNWTLSDWSIKNLRLQVEENQPWYVNLSSNFVIPETDGVDSNVNLKMIYKEFPSPLLDFSLKGHWREGNFSISGDWNQTSQMWNLKTQFNNFPFQFLKMLAIKTKTPWNWPDRPMWFSFVSDSSNSLEDWKNSQHLLRDISIEGDLGVLKTPDLRVVSLKPFRVSPFVFRIEKVDLETSFQSQLRRTQEILNLGYLTGQGEWISQEELRFRGEWSQSHWSFKNRWPKLADFVIQDSEVQAQLVKGQWTINVLNPQFNGQNVLGDIELKGTQGLQKGQIKSKLRSENFPFVMTDPLKILSAQNFNLTSDYKWNSIAPSEESISITLSSLEFDQAKLQNFKLSLRKMSDGYDFKSKIEKVVINKVGIVDARKIASLSQLPFQAGNSILNFKLNNNQQLTSWTLNLPPLVSSGAVDSETLSLKGQIHEKNSQFSVNGTLDLPIINELNNL